MSGIPGMGQRWQAVLKIRVIMIPLPENTAAGAASGDSCGVKGCCRVFRQPCRAVFTYSVPHRGRENKNPWQGIMPCLGVWELLFVEEQRNTGERVHIRQDKIHWGIGHTLCQI